jgi:hypothetical protein
MFDEHFFKTPATTFNKERGSFLPEDGRWDTKVTTERQRMGTAPKGKNRRRAP